MASPSGLAQHLPAAAPRSSLPAWLQRSFWTEPRPPLPPHAAQPSRRRCRASHPRLRPCSSQEAPPPSTTRYGPLATTAGDPTAAVRPAPAIRHGTGSRAGGRAAAAFGRGRRRIREIAPAAGHCARCGGRFPPTPSALPQVSRGSSKKPKPHGCRLMHLLSNTMREGVNTHHLFDHLMVRLSWQTAVALRFTRSAQPHGTIKGTELWSAQLYILCSTVPTMGFMPRQRDPSLFGVTDKRRPMPVRCASAASSVRKLNPSDVAGILSLPLGARACRICAA